MFKINGVRLVDVINRIWAEIRADDVFGRAAQLAYFFFLALFPFLICVVASLSVFGSADRGRALLFHLFASLLPGAAFHLISDTFNQILQSGGPLKMSFGIIAALWSASLGMSAVMDSLNVAYQVKETRSIFKQYAVAVGLTFGFAVLVVVLVLLAIFGNDVVGGRASGTLIHAGWIAAQSVLVLAGLLVVLAAMYYLGPDMKTRRWHWVTPGAIAAIVLLVAVFVGFRIYLHYSGGYSSLYGSLGSVIVLLLCFYLSGIAVLSGGVLNAVLERFVRGDYAEARRNA